VVKIPPCISPIYDQQLKRSDYDLPDGRFLFLCAYDVLSIQARKNPAGAVDAFKRAFPKNDSAVGLVIKVNNAAENPREIKQLRSYISGYSNCYVIEDIYSKPRFNSLLNVVDAFVSLHRSEGFGLIPAEAMSFGKPVIMTRWSGNLDFMTPNNSCGVEYKLVPISGQSGPYMPGQFWADPDIDHAAFFMQKLVGDSRYYAEISKQAQKTIWDDFSPHRIGQLIKKRMTSIGLIS
jgi:glycosyltransferase involved in cell wall biosynthesis